MGARYVLLLALLPCVACSLLVSTSGLSGDDAASGPDGGDGGGTPIDAGGDTSPGTDTGAGDAAIPPRACDGGFETTGFVAFTDKNGNVTFTDDTLTATVATAAKNQNTTSAARADADGVVPAYVHLSYDLTLTPSTTIYTEPGCSLVVQQDGVTLLRETPYSNSGVFGEFVNVIHPPTDDDHQRAVATLASGASTHHVDITIDTTGSTSTATTVIDGVGMVYGSLALSGTPNHVAIFCGIEYANQSATGTATTSVTMQSLHFSVCP